MTENLMTAYLAEFAIVDTQELAEELLIQAPSEPKARKFAEDYALNLGIDLFMMMPATQEQIRLYRLMGKSVLLNPGGGDRL